MLTIIFSIIAFGFIGSLSLVGIYAIVGYIYYLELQKILPPATFEYIALTLVLLFFSCYYLLFYLFNVSHLQWPLKKKVLGFLILLPLISVAYFILRYFYPVFF